MRMQKQAFEPSIVQFGRCLVGKASAASLGLEEHL